MFPVINDARGCADYWVLQKGCRASVWGPPTLSFVSLFDSVWHANVDSHPADSVVRAEISNNTVRNMRRSSY